MADAVSHTSKPQTPLSSDPPNNPSKFYSNFLYKAAFVTVFLVLLLHFPSIAPEFINQTLHARSWELLQLIFVGIAVSYGLFSKKNDETEKDDGDSKVDNAQSYVVTKLLQVSSVFDDEESESFQTIIEENNKVETLNSEYYRCAPVVVVAKQQGHGCEISRKPLLLPVRSLKQRIVNELDLGDGKIGNRSRKPRNVEFGGLDVNLEENVVVFRSPIPWQSGRMEMKENEENGIDESTSYFHSSSSNNLSTPKKLTTLTSFPSETQAKSSEDESVLSKSGTSELEKESMYDETKLFVEKKLVEKVVMETSDEDTDDDDDYFKGISSGKGEGVANDNNSVNDVGPDVDKKADEFIAKFREQIRLQRIESFRTSTSGNTFR